MTQALSDSDLHPRATAEVFGHEEAERLLLADFNRDKLPGAYLFAGPKGIGKASVAYRFVRFLLTTSVPGQQERGLFGEALPPVLPTSLRIDPEHPTARRIASGGHMNVLSIERSVDEKSKKLRGEIVVDDVRRIGNFLSKSAAEEGWRIVIVDAADEMNNNAANAILKWLEEPPERAIFLLIANHPGKLLPTIRSRCRNLTFKPPSPELFARVVEASLGTLEKNEAQALYFLSGGAPGRALTLHENGTMETYAEMMELYAADAGPVAFENFAEQTVDARKKERRFSDLAALLLTVLAGIIRCRENASDTHLPDADRALFTRMGAKKPLDYWLELWEKSAPLLADVERIHLDARVIVSGVMAALAGRESIVHYMKNN